MEPSPQDGSLMEKPTSERTKPFRLVKYFTLTSLLVIFFGTIFLSLFNTRWARSLQLTKSEEFASVIVENLNHQVFLQFIIPAALKFGKIQLRDQEQFEHLDRVVRSTLYSFKIEMVNIYDMNNVISYSFDREIIGKKEAGGAGYKSAVDGISTSKLIQRGSFLELALGFPKESQLVTFAPLRAEKPLSRISGPVIGVVEIVQNLSEDDKTIFQFQILVIVTSSIVMGVLFVILLFVVNRGEGIIQQRAQERIKLKEELSRAKHLSSLGELVAGVSHEIRNPLGIILNSAELLKKRMDSSQNSRGITEIIIEESSRLDFIISDFLKFARPAEPVLTSCRIDDVIEKNISYLSSQLEEGGYEILLDKEDDLPGSVADADMLYQAFLNLFLNAMQAMPEGGRIHVRLWAEPRSVGVLIRDEGTGIREEIFESIWDPFFTTKDKGTGLGLGIVQKIIEAHNGVIGIGNHPDGGTEITIYLPITVGE
jgi:two-component system sensor histidine kinase HydH